MPQSFNIYTKQPFKATFWTFSQNLFAPAFSCSVKKIWSKIPSEIQNDDSKVIWHKQAIGDDLCVKNSKLWKNFIFQKAAK